MLVEQTALLRSGREERGPQYIPTGGGGRQKEQRDWSGVSSGGPGATEGVTHLLQNCQNPVRRYSRCGGTLWAAEVRCFEFRFRITISIGLPYQDLDWCLA